MHITESQLLKEIEVAMSRTPENETGAMTTSDLVKALGIGEKRVRSLLAELISNGDVEHVRIFRRNISGNLSPVPAYVFKQKNNPN